MSISSYLLDTTRGDDNLSSNLAGDTATAKQTTMPDWLTLQSLTFPAAAAGVIVAWKVLQVVVTAAVIKEKWVPVVIAGVIVLATWFYKWADLDPGKRVGAFLIGAVNTLLLAAGAVGVDIALLTGAQNPAE